MTEPSQTIRNHAAFIWSVADKLRGVYKQSDYGKVILPLTVLRRLDCVLEPTKAKVLAVHKQFGDRAEFLRSAAVECRRSCHGAKRRCRSGCYRRCAR